MKEKAIALMDNCNKTLLKTVNISCVLQLLKAAEGEESPPLQVMYEEANGLTRIEKLVEKGEAQY